MKPSSTAADGDAALIARLRDLVAFDTQNPKGDERPLAEKLAADLRALGAQAVHVLPEGRHASVFARLGSRAPTWLVNCHIDTVPANTGFQHPPFVLTRVQEGGQDRLFGLGSCDTKGSIAAVLDALERQKHGRGLPDDVGILFSGDEERKGTCVRAFLRSEHARGIAHAIACEPSGCKVGVQHRGIMAARAVALSPGGHSSLADHLPAPIATLARVAVAMEALGKEQREVGPPGFQGLCMNIAGIQGGIAMNVIPARGELILSLRPSPGADVQALASRMEELARAAAGGDAIVWETEAANPPLRTRDPQVFLQRLGLEEDACTNLDFWTEAALFVESGIDAVVLGPGDIAQAHAPDEYVELTQLKQARDLFLKVFD